MVMDANGNSHKAGGRPDGGQFEKKAGQGVDDDLTPASPTRFDTPSAEDMADLADAIGQDAATVILLLPDGTETPCYRTDHINGALPAPWTAYDTMESDEDEGYSFAIDDSPYAHIVNQGDKLVTRHNLSGLDGEFDEDHWWNTDRTIGDDARLLAHNDEWRENIADDCGLDPEDMEDPGIRAEAVARYLTADSITAAENAEYDRFTASKLLYAADRAYHDDPDQDYPVPLHVATLKNMGADVTGVDTDYAAYDKDGNLHALDRAQALETAWRHRVDILQSVNRNHDEAGARMMHEDLRTDRDWTAWDEWRDPEEVEGLH